MEVEDHPLDYGDFEGTIPKGEYGGGTVQMWDRGFWAPQGPNRRSRTQGGRAQVRARGRAASRSWVLVRITEQARPRQRDELAADQARRRIRPPQGDGAARGGPVSGLGPDHGPDRRAETARRRGRSCGGEQRRGAVWHSNAHLREAKPAPNLSPPTKGPSGCLHAGFIEPQLARLVERPPSGAGWAHEIKFDGYRVQMRVQNGKANLRTRKGLDWTERIRRRRRGRRKICRTASWTAKSARWTTRRAELRCAAGGLVGRGTDQLVFFVFDLLIDGKEDSAPAPERPQETIEGDPEAEGGAHDPLRRAFRTDCRRLWLSACRMKLEGIVSKRLDAPYAPGAAMAAGRRPSAARARKW